VAFNGANVGINIYTNPLFTNVTDLINNQNGPPNCSSFQSVTQCMGYDPLTSTLTVPSIISDLQASCAGCSGKGYQLPNKTCALIQIIQYGVKVLRWFVLGWCKCQSNA